MSDYIHSGSNKMNKVGAYTNENKILLADKLGHAKVSSLKEQNLLNTIATVQQHSNKITQLEADANKVRGAYVYKGTVETEFDLPLNNNSVGDVYNVSSTGMNYAWNGENWDELGNTASNGNNVTDWTWDTTYSVFRTNYSNSASTVIFNADPTNPNSAPVTKALCMILTCSEASDDILTQDKHVKVTVEIQTDSTVQTIYGDICAFDNQGFGNLTILVYPDHGSYMLFLRADHALYNGDDDIETKSWFSGPTISILNVENFYIKSITLSASAYNGHNIGGNYIISYLLGN